MEASEKRSLRRRVIGWGIFLLLAGALVVLRTRFFMLAWITSGSMEPTLLKGDLVLINHAAYKSRLPKRGEVVALQTLERDQIWVKRAVAEPGDVVLVRPAALFLNGRKVDEPYMRPDTRPDPNQYKPPTRIPEGHVWVLGDNRGNSDDSRNWGPLERSYLVGKVVCICWPANRMRSLR